MKLFKILIMAVFLAGATLTSACGLLVTNEQMTSIAGTVLEAAYMAGGAAVVSTKIDQLVKDGKITQEQAALLKAAAQKSYDNAQKKLKNK